MHRQITNLQFNSTTKNIDIKKDQKTSQLPWQMGVLDDLNVEIQIRDDLNNGGLKSSYLIADHKDITARQFVNEGLVKYRHRWEIMMLIKYALIMPKKIKVPCFG